MSDDPDLRSRLQRIASSAGDPPEHGLERIAARRRRRRRRRRGAVATAAALAALATGLSLTVGTDRRDSVTASGAAPPEAAPAEVPRTVEVRCEPTGIVVPVASVRAQNDGLHIRVHNLLGDETTLRVTGREGWSSGDIPVVPGVDTVRQPVPPGRVTIGCTIEGEVQRRQVNLVDPAGYYVKPALECEDGLEERLRNLRVEPPERSLVRAARQALDARVAGGTGELAAVAPRGYPAQTLSVHTDDPTVQLERDGRVVGLVHVRGAAGAAEPPWVAVPRADVCAAELAEPPGEGDAPATTASTA